MNHSKQRRKQKRENQFGGHMPDASYRVEPTTGSKATEQGREWDAEHKESGGEAGSSAKPSDDSGG